MRNDAIRPALASEKDVEADREGDHSRSGHQQPEHLTAKDLSLDVWLTCAGLTLTVLATALFVHDLWQSIGNASALQRWAEANLYITIIIFLIYGNVSYQLARLGHLQRLKSHTPEDREALEAVYDRPAPSLAILVPSYKEEPDIVRQTLLSAALQAYPNRRVTLLIDDPQPHGDREAQAALDAMRELVVELNDRFRTAAAPFVAKRDLFREHRKIDAYGLRSEAATIATLYAKAADWLECLAVEMSVANHTDAFFTQSILHAPARAHRERAKQWFKKSRGPQAMDVTAVAREYERLAVLFHVELTAFERKRYANLSHEPNKAMNLNAYIALLGQSFREIEHSDALHLTSSTPEEASLLVPDADYLITLDADSLLLPDYALRLVGLMEAPGNERIAVAQTPYSAVPNPSSLLERTAGATTDIQYLIHQGFTYHGATFWVGANAVLRHAALHDIVQLDEERGHPIKRFIQDRTVIEDTESTLDLIDKGWTLFNYPERLAYSATPPDFGALSIQRARWANGGLIILPKLLSYIFKGPRRLEKLREGFFRIHYLTSIAGVNLGLLVLLMFPFPDQFQSWWLPLTAVPYYALYARDLHQLGYGKKAAILQVYALNLLLLPVNMGGVLRSLQQVWRKQKIPFHRTPKVAGRTCIPARYLVALFGLTAFALASSALHAILGRWAYATFSLINAAVFLYGTAIFIGFRNAWSDITAGIPAWRRAAIPVWSLCPPWVGIRPETLRGCESET